MRVPPGFEEAYRAWLSVSLQAAGVRKQALRSGLGRGERAFLRDVWWPLFGSFERLLPHAKLRDCEGRAETLSFVFLKPPFRIGIRLDGDAGPNRRSAALAAGCWSVLHLAYAKVRHDPASCRRALLGAFERLGGSECAGEGAVRLTASEKEIARLAARSERPITPAQAADALAVCDKTARSALRSLVDKRVLQPAGGGARRIRAYEPALEPALLLGIPEEYKTIPPRQQW